MAGAVQRQAAWRLAVEEAEAAAADGPWDSDSDDATSMVSETASALCRQALSAHSSYEQEKLKYANPLLLQATAGELASLALGEAHTYTDYAQGHDVETQQQALKRPSAIKGPKSPFKPFTTADDGTGFATSAWPPHSHRRVSFDPARNECRLAEDDASHSGSRPTVLTASHVERPLHGSGDAQPASAEVAEALAVGVARMVDMGDDTSVASFVAHAQELARLRAASMSYLQTLQRKPMLLTEVNEHIQQDWAAPAPAATTPDFQSTSDRSAGCGGGLQSGGEWSSLRERFILRLEPVSDVSRAPALAAVEALRAYIQAHGRPGPTAPAFPLGLDEWFPGWAEEARRLPFPAAVLDIMRARQDAATLQDTCACIVWGSAAADLATSAELLEAGAPAALLAAVAAHPGSPRVIGGAVGALLALGLGHKAAQRQLEAEGALRAIRAAMVAYPNMTFSGFFRELQPWLKSQSDNLETHMLTPEREPPVSPPTPKLAASPQQAGLLVDDDVVSTVSSSSSSLESFVASSTAPVQARKAERRVVVPDGSGFGYMGERHPIELVSWLMVNPMPMFKARKSNGLVVHSLKRTYIWISPDGSQLHYSYKAAEGGVLPSPLRSIATAAVAGLRVGHVTQRLQQQAPRGSEERSLTLMMHDATCLSMVFADQDAMRQCRAATGLVALAAHAARCLHIEERVGRLASLAAVALPVAVVAAEVAVDRGLKRASCTCGIPCAGRYCTEITSQLAQMAAAAATEARRHNALLRITRTQAVVAQTQQRLASARQSGATQEQRDVLEGELSMAAHTAQHAHVLLAQLPQWQQAPAGTELSSPLPVVSDEQLGRLVETIAADTDHDSALAAVHSLKRLTADRMAATERTRVVQAGGVEVLCAMMARGDVEGGVAAARTLAQLARSKTLHGVLADAGVLPRLQSLLHYGLSVRGPTGDAAAAAAAMAMVNLCSGDRGTRRLVMLHGGMRSVVQLLALPVAPSDEALGNTLALYRSLISTWEPDEHPIMQELAEDTVPSLVGLVRGGTERESPPTCTHHIVAAWVLSSLARASLRFQDLIRMADGVMPLTKMLRQPDARAMAAAVAALSNLVPGNIPNQVAVRRARVYGLLIRVAAAHHGQPVAHNALKAAHALGTVLGPELRRAFKELEATVKALCTPEQRQALWMRMELKAWLAARQT